VKQFQPQIQIETPFARRATELFARERIIESKI